MRIVPEPLNFFRVPRVHKHTLTTGHPTVWGGSLKIECNEADDTGEAQVERGAGGGEKKSQNFSSGDVLSPRMLLLVPVPRAAAAIGRRRVGISLIAKHVYGFAHSLRWVGRVNARRSRDDRLLNWKRGRQIRRMRNLAAETPHRIFTGAGGPGPGPGSGGRPGGPVRGAGPRAGPGAGPGGRGPVQGAGPGGRSGGPGRASPEGRSGGRPGPGGRSGGRAGGRGPGAR